ncbi:hypothetical protein [Caldicellulosiruptor morganii]|uniref:hypothetical protein n=1 Tax=Caldicellulosiruptor morganii TaxID=1387555 RepID=UPI0005EBCCD5|nr:hypothetical protein [Caldicellulosiruptor morganii]
MSIVLFILNNLFAILLLGFSLLVVFCAVFKRNIKWQFKSFSIEITTTKDEDIDNTQEQHSPAQ